VYNNIKFGKDDATEEEVKEAARLAGLDRDIVGLQKGYETMIGERGVMLSGGQKQRMVLARALLKNSKLLLLDDCLSAVDTQTEKLILANLSEYLQDKTAIITTHRIFTSLNFDQVIMLDHGCITEHGTHEELIRQNGRYARLFRYQTQMDGEQQPTT
jgi:ATP-binding cassette subfamily B protein